jgi:hypothetical protein
MAYLIKHGPRFYLRYWQHGRRIEESTGLVSEREAKKRLAQRVAQLATGERVEPARDRLRYEQLRQNMLDDYQATERRDLTEVQGRLRHLDPFFTSMKVTAITPTRITAYALARKQAGAANGTINRELALLRHAMRLVCARVCSPRCPPSHSSGSRRRGRGSSSGTPSRLYAVSCRRISSSRSGWSTPTAGGCRAKCSPDSGRTWTSAPARCGWTRGSPKTTMRESCISRPSFSMAFALNARGSRRCNGS